VDPLTLSMVVLFAGLVVGIVLLGLFAPGNGSRQLDWRPTRSPETEAQNEVDDLDQMLESLNARRRARGQAELTEDELHERVAAERRELRDRQR